MSNIFGLLSAGTKYNKAKNNEAIKIFKGKGMFSVTCVNLQFSMILLNDICII